MAGQGQGWAPPPGSLIYKSLASALALAGVILLYALTGFDKTKSLVISSLNSQPEFYAYCIGSTLYLRNGDLDSALNRQQVLQQFILTPVMNPANPPLAASLCKAGFGSINLGAGFSVGTTYSLPCH